MLGDADIGPAIAVKDIEAAKKFYGGVLGLKQSGEDPGGVIYKSGNSTVLVYPSQYAGTNQATYAGWVVDDVEAVANELKGKGVTLEQYDSIPGVKREGDIHLMGDMKAIWFKDPDGNILSVSNMPG